MNDRRDPKPRRIDRHSPVAHPQRRECPPPPLARQLTSSKKLGVESDARGSKSGGVPKVQPRRPGSHEPSYARTADGNVRSWVRVRRNRWSATASVSLDTLCNLFGLRISTGGYLFFACFAIAQKRVSKLAQNCGNLRSLRCRPAGTVRSPPISLIPLRTVGSDIPVASATAAIPPSPIDSASLESGSPLRGLSAIAIISRPGSRVSPKGCSDGCDHLMSYRHAVGSRPHTRSPHFLDSNRPALSCSNHAE